MPNAWKGEFVMSSEEMEVTFDILSKHGRAHYIGHLDCRNGRARRSHLLI